LLHGFVCCHQGKALLLQTVSSHLGCHPPGATLLLCIRHALFQLWLLVQLESDLVVLCRAFADWFMLWLVGACRLDLVAGCTVLGCAVRAPCKSASDTALLRQALPPLGAHTRPP
jgi:hypothetical protein